VFGSSELDASESVTLTCETGVKFAISPESHNFGSVQIGTITPEFVFTVTNVGGVATGAVLVQVSGLGFSLGSTQTCATNLAPGASCSVGIMFSPTGPRNDGSLKVSNGPTPLGMDQASLSGGGHL
jgi:hypothetical protein